ncbi:MAG TPA: hypothetical protein PLQ52_13325, partial [Lacunisphaera sp.]|nr:hypothetical protein [Lacunisphaera sp.]
FPVLRLRGDYLAIVTLGFGEIIRLVLINWTEFSNGYAGISGIPRPTFFGIPFTAADNGFAAVFGLEFTPLYRTIFLYYLILCLALLTAFVTLRLRRLPVGRAWEALREDEIACRSLGINTTNSKLTAFACGAMFAGFAGSFFATRQGFISPGILAVFIFGLLVRKAPPVCGIVGLLTNVVAYGALKVAAPHIQFLNRMALCFALCLLVMTVIRLVKPLPRPFEFRHNTTVNIESSTGARLAGYAVVIITLALYVIFSPLGVAK